MPRPRREGRPGSSLGGIDHVLGQLRADAAAARADGALAGAERLARRGPAARGLPPVRRRPARLPPARAQARGAAGAVRDRAAGTRGGVGMTALLALALAVVELPRKAPLEQHPGIEVVAGTVEGPGGLRLRTLVTAPPGSGSTPGRIPRGCCCSGSATAADSRRWWQATRPCPPTCRWAAGRRPGSST